MISNNIIVSQTNISLREPSLIQGINANYSLFEKCMRVESLFFNILQFLGSYTFKYELVERNKEDCHKKFQISNERKMHGDRYIRHLKSVSGLGCPIVVFYLKNIYDNVMVHFKTISILSKNFQIYSSDLFESTDISSINIINNTLYKREQIIFFKKFPSFKTCRMFKNVGKMYEDQQFPFRKCYQYCINNNYESDQYCNECLENKNYIKNHPYICNCNEHEYLDSYMYYSCDVCALINKDYKRGPPLWRNYKKCKVCKKGQADMLADNYDSD